jgi:hypothetical protein
MYLDSYIIDGKAHLNISYENSNYLYNIINAWNILKLINWLKLIWNPIIIINQVKIGINYEIY